MLYETFVFFDLVPNAYPWRRNLIPRLEIIEISFVAVLRENLQNATFGVTPKVSKMTLHFNPNNLHEDIMQETDLTRPFLQKSPKFDEKLDLMVSFLDELPKPVCLIAHNGHSYQFRVLRTVIEEHASFLNDLYCIDSFIALRDVLKGTAIRCHTLCEVGDVDQQIADGDTKDDKSLYNLPALSKRLLNKDIRGLDYNRAEPRASALMECIAAVNRLFLHWADNKPLSSLITVERFPY